MLQFTAHKNDLDNGNIWFQNIFWPFTTDASIQFSSYLYTKCEKIPCVMKIPAIHYNTDAH